jgi:hypothetical protein
LHFTAPKEQDKCEKDKISHKVFSLKNKGGGKKVNTLYRVFLRDFLKKRTVLISKPNRPYGKKPPETQF